VQFTLAWLGLGAVTPGYSQAGAGPERRGVRRRTAACRARDGRRCGADSSRCGREPGASGPGWLGSAHVAAATVAFGGLHLAALTGALSPALSRRLRVAGVVSLAVALPHLVQFVSGPRGPGTAAGYLEKAFTTVLLAWCAAVAWRADAG